MPGDSKFLATLDRLLNGDRSDRPVRLLRQYHAVHSIASIERVALECSSLPLMTLRHIDEPIATVAFVDRLPPRLGVVLPDSGYQCIRPALLRYGDHLWRTGFASDKTAEHLKQAVHAIASRLRLTLLGSDRPFTVTSIDLFDTSHDPLACPFLLADARSSGAGVPATLQTPPRSGPAHDDS